MNGDPEDMLVSLNGLHTRMGQESRTDFADAMRADRRRIEDGEAVVEGRYPSVPYRYLATLSPHVETYLDVFGDDQVYVGLLDDLADDAEAFYHAVSSFLGLSTSFTPDLDPVNSYSEVQAGLLWRLWLGLPQRVRNRLRVLLPDRDGPLAPLYRRAKTWYYEHVFEDASPDPVDPQLRRDLEREFTPEVERLSQLIDRDLSHWLDTDLTDTEARAQDLPVPPEG